MDPNYVDEEEEAAAMAAMMGFSGFGSHKPPAKRRKFATDAFVDGQDPVAPVDKGGKKGQGSGGNTIPLGKARVFGTTPASKAVELVTSNDEEIDLGEEALDGPQYIDTSQPAPILIAEEAPHIPHFEPPPGVSTEEAKEMQSRIDAILASVGPSEPLPATIPITQSSETANGLPPRPTYNSPKALNDTASVRSSRPSHRGGPRNENWYLDYYDPNFIENPWAKLEKEKGLGSLGHWPERQAVRMSK